MSLEEDIHAIRQDIERLVHHLTGDKRPGENNLRDRQRDPSVQGETVGYGQLTQEEKEKWPPSGKTEKDAQACFCIRGAKPPRVWGPFQTVDEGWRWLYKRLDKNYVPGTYRGGTRFEEEGSFTVETLWLF